MFAIMEPSATTGTYRTVGPATKSGACDQCRHRKVRCDMSKPCATCSEKGFNCTYDKIRKKRGPAGKRVSEIRRHQASVPLTSPTADPAPETIRDSPTATSPSVDEAIYGNLTPVEGSFPEYVNSRSETMSTVADVSDQHVGQPQLTPILPQGPGYLSIGAPTSSWEGSLEHSSTVWSPSAAIDPLLAQIPSFPVDSPGGADQFAALPEQFMAPPEADVWPPLISEANLLPWIDVYFKRLHPTIPILNRTTLYHDMLLRTHRTDKQYGSMLLSLCAFAMTQPIQIEERASMPSRTMQARMMMEEAVKMRNTADFGEDPTLHAVLTSFFLFACLFGNNQHKAAWHRLREAVDLAYSLGLHDPRAYQNLTVEQREQWLRTYLVLSVTERAYALQRQHSIGFRGRPSMNARFMQNFDLTSANESISGLISREKSDAVAMTGLLYLMESFDCIDEGVIACWNGHCDMSDGQCSNFDRRRAVQVFRALRVARESSYSGKQSFAPGTASLPLAALGESQIADISITQTWLVNRLWSLCLSHNLISHSTDHPELRNDFAFHVAQAAMLQARSLDPQALEVHGVGLIEKIYDIGTGVITALHQTPTFNVALLDYPIARCDVDLSLTHGLSLPGSVSIRHVIEDLSSLILEFRNGDHQFAQKFLAELATVPGFQSSAMRVTPHTPPPQEWIQLSSLSDQARASNADSRTNCP